MKRRVLAGVLALVTFAVVPEPAVTAQSRSDSEWIEARAGNRTIVISNAGEAEAKALLARIERVRGIVLSAIPGIRDLDEPLIVVAPRDVNGMRELVGDAARRNSGLLVAASLPAPYSHHLAVRAGARQAQRDQLLMHEYLHRVTQANLGDAPAWLDEGLSEFWSTLEIDGDRVKAGKAIGRHVRALRSQKLIPLADLIAIERGRYDSARGKLALFYAQSWALVHHLVTQRASPAASYAPQLPEDLGTLQKAFESYVRAGRFAPIDLPRPSLAAESTTAQTSVRIVAEPEVLAIRASVMVYGERPAVALRLAERALELNPAEPLALEAKGLYYFLTNQQAEARAWLKKAAEHPAASFLAHYYYAVSAAGTPLVVEQHLRRALELKPGFAPALDRLRRPRKG